MIVVRNANRFEYSNEYKIQLAVYSNIRFLSRFVPLFLHCFLFGIMSNIVCHAEPECSRQTCRNICPSTTLSAARRSPYFIGQGDSRSSAMTQCIYFSVLNSRYEFIFSISLCRFAICNLRDAFLAFKPSITFCRSSIVFLCFCTSFNSKTDNMGY